MKILQLCTKVPLPPLDGGSIATYNLSLGFAKAQHQVFILAMNTPKHYQNHTKDQCIEENIQLITINIDTRIKPFKALGNLLFSKLPYNAERFCSIKYEKKLIQLLQTHTFDIVQLEGLYVTPYIETIREYTNARIALRAHNIESEIWERSLKTKKGLTKWYLKILTKRLKNFESVMINKYDILVPITDRDNTSFTILGNTKPAFVSPTGINFPIKKTYSPSPECPSLFFLGSLDWFPNQEGLQWFINKVWPDIHMQLPDLYFTIAGRNAPQWLIKKCNLPNIQFLGEIKDAHQFMQSKAIMVVPLFSGSGMRIKIIEGMSLGKVIITTAIGAEGIPVEYNKNILIANSPEEFSSCINNLVLHPALFEKISKNAEKFIEENYDNLSISSSLAAFYKSQIV